MVQGTWRILLVDDDEEDYILMDGMLAKAKGRKIDIEWARNYDVAKQQISANHFDAVLVDYHLGHRTGIEFIREITNNEYHAPAILLTGQGSYDVDVEAMQAGATLYVTKDEVNPLLIERVIRYAIERKQSEDELRRARDEARANEARLKLAQQAGGVGFFDRDLVTNESIGTEQLDLIYGLVSGEGNAERWADMIHPEDRAAVDEQVQQAIREQRSEVMSDYRVIRPDGQVRWLSTRELIFYDPPGKPIRMIGASVDITNRKQSEEELRKNSEALRVSEERFYKAFNATPNALVISRLADGLIQEVNDSFLRLFGYEREEVIGKSSVELDMFGNPADRQEATRRLREEHTLRDFELDIRTKSEEIRRASLSIELLKIGGDIIMLTIIQDITERKQVEEALRESEQTLRATFEQAAVGIARVSPLGRELWANQRLCQISGYSQEELLTKSLEDITFIEDIEKEHSLVDQVLAGEMNSYTLEKRYVRKDGVLTWVNLTASLVRDASGTPKYFVKIIEDISTRKSAETALAARNNEIHAMTQQLWQTAKLATMGELAASVAHELNNPLAILSLRVENLASAIPVNTPEQNDLSIMAQEIDRMAGLVANLLQFSRSGQRQISSLDIREEINQTLELMHNHLVNRRITAQRVFAPDIPLVQADRQQIRQLFLNLFSNAGDAMPEGGTLMVRVKPSIENLSNGMHLSVVIEIEDTGVGISSEDLARVTEPFFSTKPEGKGTGLGLSICRRIVEEHEGSLKISSPGKGQGTTIQINLPSTNGAKPHFLEEMA